MPNVYSYKLHQVNLLPAIRGRGGKMRREGTDGEWA